MLCDLTAIDERERRHREGQPPSDFTVVYHLLSLERNADVRLKVALQGEKPVDADHHRHLALGQLVRARGVGHVRHRLRRPPAPAPDPDAAVPGSAIRCARSTRRAPPRWGRSRCRSRSGSEQEELLKLRPADWGLETATPTTTRSCSSTSARSIRARTACCASCCSSTARRSSTSCPTSATTTAAQEKMGERQTWHTYIPYTDRVDYLGGVMNNLAYLLSVEKLAGIEVPDRVKVIRVMMVELFRISSHLVWYGTFAQDVGPLSPVFYMFTDREKLFDIVEAICGGRMHPNWFRIGGVAQDLPAGWDRMMRDFLAYLPKRLRRLREDGDEEPHLQGAHAGRRRLHPRGGDRVGRHRAGPARHAASTGTSARSGPTRATRTSSSTSRSADAGDCYARAVVRVEEMRQSLRIIQQCVDHMPAGPYKAEHPLTTPPPKERTMQDIETLITHFLSVSVGAGAAGGRSVGARSRRPRAPPATTWSATTAPIPYRTRIRVAQLPAHADAAADHARAADRRPARDPGRDGLRAGRRRPMSRHRTRESAVDAEPRRDRRDRGADRASTPIRARLSIEALMVVQQHRALGLGRGAARHRRDDLDVGRRARRRRDLLQPDLPAAGRPPRDPALRQRELLDRGLREDPPRARSEARHPLRRDHGGRPLHAAADRVPGRLRARAGADDRRGHCTSTSRPRSSTRSWRLRVRT